MASTYAVLLTKRVHRRALAMIADLPTSSIVSSMADLRAAVRSGVRGGAAQLVTIVRDGAVLLVISSSIPCLP